MLKRFIYFILGLIHEKLAQSDECKDSETEQKPEEKR